MKLYSCLLIFWSLISSGAHAAGTAKWVTPNVAGWDILVDQTLNNGCFIMTTFERGSALRVGFNRGNWTAYFLLGNEEWKSIEVGKHYDISLQFDNAGPWTASARGLKMDNTVFLWAETTKAEFLTELAQSHGLSVFYRGKEIASLSLSGSSAAVAEMVRCQSALETNDNTSSDPFKSSTAPSSDPFQ